MISGVCLAVLGATATDGCSDYGVVVCKHSPMK